jgi:hypothetical protein
LINREFDSIVIDTSCMYDIKQFGRMSSIPAGIQRGAPKKYFEQSLTVSQ